MALLTDGQKATIKTAILTEPALAEAVALRDDNTITAYCNATRSPNQKIWKPVYTADDLFQATDINIYIARSVAERQAYDLLVTMDNLDPTRSSIRSGIVNIFSGAAQLVVAQREAILNDMARSASWTEYILGGVNQTTGSVTAWVANWTGELSAFDVSSLLNG